MRRRDMLVMAPALLAQARAQDATTKLRDAARRVGMAVGSASEVDLRHDIGYAKLLADNVSLFAPNMSWQRMSPTPADTLVGLDPNIAWAEAAGLRLTGYHLLWHQRLPPWFDGLDRTAAERAIDAHIAFLAGRFGPLTSTWNVVNEAIRPADGAPGGLRRSPLLDKFGTRFFDIASAAARQHAPTVTRVYNDYDLELATANDEARRRSLLLLLDELQGRGVPVQAVGLQSHLRTRSFDRFDPARFAAFLGALAGRGLDLLITELDVQDGGPGDIAARDRQVADVYRRFLDVALAQPRLRTLVFWGLSDRHSWLNDPARPDYARADGEPLRPAPFDPALAPKPALRAILAALAAAPVRSG